MPNWRAKIPLANHRMEAWYNMLRERILAELPASVWQLDTSAILPAAVMQSPTGAAAAATGRRQRPD